jgi:hypothetical protein
MSDRIPIYLDMEERKAKNHLKEFLNWRINILGFKERSYEENLEFKDVNNKTFKVNVKIEKM